MLVAQILARRELYSVDEAQSVEEVTRRMAELNVGAIVVLAKDKLCGVFSERDLLTRVVLPAHDPSRTLVADVMTRDVATVDETDTLEFAMESMRANNCRHLPVLRGERVIGFLSMRDLMHFELNRKTEELLHMRAYIHGTA